MLFGNLVPRLSPFLILSLVYVPELCLSAQQGDYAIQYGDGDDNDPDEGAICVFHSRFGKMVPSVNEESAGDIMFLTLLFQSSE